MDFEEIIGKLENARYALFEAWSALEDLTDCAIQMADEQAKNRFTWDELEEVCKVFEDDQEEDPEHKAMSDWIAEQGPTF